MKPGSKVIGLTLGQKSFLLAEIGPKPGANGGSRYAVLHYAEFPFPEGLSLDTPQKLGESLAAFLKGRDFSTRDTIIGLPAKRLVTRRKEIPAANMAVAASTLRLQAEGEFSSELDNLVMDFAGAPSSVESSTVLLIATNRGVVDQCLTMAKAAGLRVQGITATTAALGRATSRLPGGDGLVLNISPTGAEIAIQHGQDTAHLRHLNGAGATAEGLGALAGEIRRMVASIPKNGTPMTMAVWGGPPGSTSTGSILEQRLSMPVITPQLSALVTSDASADAFATPVAVALSAVDPAGLPVDFLNSRLAPPKPPRVSMEVKIAVVLGVIVVGLIVAAFVHLGMRQAELDRISAQVNKNNAQVRQASSIANRLNEARKWMRPGPFFVTVLRDVTTLFPQQPNTIWVDHLNNLRDVASWEIAGKAVTDTQVRELVNNMIQHREPFSNAKLTYLQQEPTSRLYSFRLQFSYDRSKL